MTDVVYDVVVVGAGIVGLGTAYHLAKSGQRTLILEQFPIPHGRGSSHGHTRIIRHSYEKDFYIPQMIDAYQEWFDLEKEAGTQLYIKTGMVAVGGKGSRAVGNQVKSLNKYNSPHKVVSAAQLAERFPQFSYTDDYDIMISETAGILLSDKCMMAYLKLFQQKGGIVRDTEKVTSIMPGNQVTITTDKGVYKARNVVLAAGPWALKLTSQLGLKLPLKAERTSVFFWRNKSGISHGADKFPVFVHHISSASTVSYFYALPAFEYPNHIKSSYHAGNMAMADPDERDYIDDQETLPKVSQYLKKHVPGVDWVRPSVIETCMYTITPDNDPIVDRHPGYPNIMIAAGFSGHGFKLAPIVGKIITAMVRGDPLPYDIKPYSIDRFTPKSAL